MTGPRRLLRLGLLVIVPVAAVAASAYFYALGGRHVSTDNAYVRADVVAISTEIDGRVALILVDDNQFVSAGQLLFEIDPEPFQIEFAAADAELSMVRLQIESLRAQYRESEVEIRAAKERIRYLKLEYERQRELSSRGHGSRARFEAAEHDLKTARQHTDALRQRELMVIADLGGEPNLPMKQHPRYMRAQAARDRAALDLERTLVHAPLSGYLGNVTLEVGEQVEAGESVFPLVATGDPWVEANMKEVHLTYVEVGQPAIVEIDSYPDHVWKASVESISPATGAEFALLPAQNATGNWVKVVQRVPVKLRLNLPPNMPPLRAGMTATVEIDTGHERPLGALIESVLAGTGGGDGR